MSSSARTRHPARAHFTLFAASVAIAVLGALAGCGPDHPNNVVTPESSMSIHDGWYRGSLSRESTCLAHTSAESYTCSIEGNMCNAEDASVDPADIVNCPVQVADNSYSFDCEIDFTVYCDDWTRHLIPIRYQTEVRVDGDQMTGSFTMTGDPTDVPCTLTQDGINALCQTVSFAVRRVGDVVGDCTDESTALSFECEEDSLQAKTLGRGSLDFRPRILRHILQTVIAQSQGAAD